jgi:hypothetical protein
MKFVIKLSQAYSKKIRNLFIIFRKSKISFSKDRLPPLGCHHQKISWVFWNPKPCLNKIINFFDGV